MGIKLKGPSLSLRVSQTGEDRDMQSYHRRIESLYT